MDREEEYKKYPWWIVVARGGQFVAGARTEADAVSAVKSLNTIREDGVGSDRYRHISRPASG